MDDKNKMLIDAAHPEETRVVVLRDGRVEEFDYESATRRPLRGNIYLAKVTRVEPSLQAAFIEYGGNRHGFLAFSEIHPDYYQIPVADRERLLAEEAARHSSAGDDGDDVDDDDRDDDYGDEVDDDQEIDANDVEANADAADDEDDDDGDADVDAGVSAPTGRAVSALEVIVGADRIAATVADDDGDGEGEPDADGDGENDGEDGDHRAARAGNADPGEDDGSVESVGSEDALEELPRRSRRLRRQYRIQEVIKRRQIILVQVVKEERGNKGAALTTYLSLAGRYTVLMPNMARGGGISRKITNVADRKRLRKIAAELEVPSGQGLIIRTAGAARNKAEIKRDFEYLQRLWENVRDLTLKSSAPTLVYEEGDLIKRSIRDLYSKEIGEVLVAGDEAYKDAKTFMRMLMPSHAKNVRAYKEPEPLFSRYRIERQLNAMFSPFVGLPSGGYVVINQTEALVAVDVNSGRSTREHSIEETALGTNLEAAEEISRQLKLRDLAGLIVIDFIDMEERRNNRSVERRLKDCLKHDRARIQVGRISHFGLLEMSRQRLRTGVVEGSTSQCPHCQGTGVIRSIESVALSILRALEDAFMAGSEGDLTANTSVGAALYILNQKREYILDLQERYGATVTVTGDERLQGANFTIERTATTAEGGASGRSVVQVDWGLTGSDTTLADGDGSRPKARKRRRKRRTRDDRAGSDVREVEAQDAQDLGEAGEQDGAETEVAAGDDDAKPRRPRRRGKRGGRKNRRGARNAEDGVMADEAGGDDGAPALAGANGDDGMAGSPGDPTPGESEDDQAEDGRTVSAKADGERETRRPRRRRGTRRIGNGRATRDSEAGKVGMEASDPASGGMPAKSEKDDDGAADKPARPRRKPRSLVAAVESVDDDGATVAAAKADRPETGSDTTAAEKVADHPAKEKPPATEKPTRRGWWQRRIG